MREREAHHTVLGFRRSRERREIVGRVFVLFFWLVIVGRRMLRRLLRLPIELGGIDDGHLGTNLQ
jgi:hypothetical protein